MPVFQRNMAVSDTSVCMQQPVKCRFYMKGVHDGMDFAELGCACFFGHGRAFYCTDQQIFGCVGEINKF